MAIIGLNTLYWIPKYSTNLHFHTSNSKIIILGLIKLILIFCHNGTEIWSGYEKQQTYNIRTSFIARYVYTYEEFVFVTEATY